MKIVIPYFSFIVLFLIFLPKYNISNDNTLINGYRYNKRKDVFIFILILVFLNLFSAFRHIISISIDEYAYRNRWDHYLNISFISLIQENLQEFIFKFYFWLSTRIFSTNQGGIIFTAVFITSSALYVLKRDCIDFKYGLLLTLATGWLWDTYNGIQQFAAVAMFIICYKVIVNKNIYEYLLYAIFCYFIHQAAIFVVPLYFLSNNKIDRKMQLIILFCTSCVLIFLYHFVPYLSNIFVTLEQYSDIIYKERRGVNIITRIIALAPAIVAFYFSPRFNNNDILTLFCANMTYIHAGIMLAAFKDTYIARFSLFTSFFVILFLSRIGKYFYNESTFCFFKNLSLILYGIVTFMRMYNSLYFFNFSL